MIIGEIVWFHYRSDLVDERMHVDSARLDPIGRLAGRLNYTRVDSRFSLPALPVPEGDLDPTL
jgi:flavin reductase (DIM6/NTAB) family NADH-FMN oxidoreductase RutF